MMMNSQECQTNKHFWQTHNTTQTPIVVKYDEIVQVNLVKEDEDRRESKRQQRLDEQRQVEETLKEINEQTREGIREKDEEIAALQRQLKATEQEMAIFGAQTAEKESTIESLKGVILQKDQVIEDIQAHTAKLMERLCTAEQKLFELQDSFTDSKSMRSSRIERDSELDSRYDRDSFGHQ